MERFNVPRKQLKRGNISFSDGSCIRLIEDRNIPGVIISCQRELLIGRPSGR